MKNCTSYKMVWTEYDMLTYVEIFFIIYIMYIYNFIIFIFFKLVNQNRNLDLYEIKIETEILVQLTYFSVYFWFGFFISSVSLVFSLTSKCTTVITLM